MGVLSCLRPQVLEAVARSALEQPVSRAAALILAAEEGKLGIGFSGGGFSLPFFVGVLNVLRRLGLLTANTPVAGSSAGSLVAASISCGFDDDLILACFEEVCEDCREKGTYQRLSASVGAMLQKHLPVDAHERCSHRTHVGISKVFPYLHHKLLSQYSGREQLMEALLTSCHIPRYSTSSLTTRCNGRVCMDGGLTDLVPLPTSSSSFIKVSCLPSSIVRKLPLLPSNKKRALHALDIAPDSFVPWPHTLETTIQYALSPGPPEYMAELLEAGRRDAISWALQAGFSPALDGSLASDTYKLPAKAPSLLPAMHPHLAAALAAHPSLAAHHAGAAAAAAHLDAGSANASSAVSVPSNGSAHVSTQPVIASAASATSTDAGSHSARGRGGQGAEAAELLKQDVEIASAAIVAAAEQPYNPALAALAQTVAPTSASLQRQVGILQAPPGTHHHLEQEVPLSKEAAAAQAARADIVRKASLTGVPDPVRHP